MKVLDLVHQRGGQLLLPVTHGNNAHLSIFTDNLASEKLMNTQRTLNNQAGRSGELTFLIWFTAGPNVFFVVHFVAHFVVLIATTKYCRMRHDKRYDKTYDK